MKQTVKYIIAIATVLWMAIPQVKSQTVNEDFDPGIMYVMCNEGMNINFQEGNEWEITFTAIDTLGYKYGAPVGMELKGGVYGDSAYVLLQSIDSILMYQPEPVMQPGVFVITEDYFPYIAQVDSTTTIHFYADMPLDLPAKGQKVVGLYISATSMPRGSLDEVIRYLYFVVRSGERHVRSCITLSFSTSHSATKSGARSSPTEAIVRPIACSLSQ